MARAIFRKLLKPERWSSLRPNNIFLEPFVVYQVIVSDIQVVTVVDKKKQVLLVQLTEQRRRATRIWYELWFYKSVAYSFFRSLQINEAQQLFQAVADGLHQLESCIKDEDIHQDALLIHEIVKLMRSNPAWSSAHVAARLDLSDLFSTGHPSMLENINSQVRPDLLTPLHVAIMFNHTRVVNAILCLHHAKPSMVRLNLTDIDGNTMVHLASISSTDTLSAVLLFLNSLSNPDRLTYVRAVNKRGLNPLQMACYVDKPENVRLFLKTGIPLDLMVINGLEPKPEPERCGADNRTAVWVKLKGELLEDMDDRLIKLGGSPIHWIKSRKCLEQLVELGIPMNVQNLKGETPLHVAVGKRSIKCYLYVLCCHGGRKMIDAVDVSGNTALHRAVSEADAVAVQALLVFGADHGCRNNKKQTARHIAAGDLDESSCHILSVLHLVGAARCTAEADLGCHDGCAPDGSYNGTPVDIWPKFDDQTLFEEQSQFIIQNALRHRGSKSAKMICFDGGGIRGVFSVQILIEIEKYLKKPINEYFNWISGTSAGSVLAASLSLGVSLFEMRRRVILNFKDIVVDSVRGNFYSGTQKFLQDAIGSKVRLNQVKNSKLIILACLADTSPFQLHLFRSYPSPEEILGKPHVKENIKIWKACLASGTIPMHDQLSSSTYLDGGFIANNPTLDTLVEVTRHNSALEATGNQNRVEPLELVVSIGTGVEPSRKFHVPKYRFNKIAEYAEFAEMFMQQMVNPNAHVVRRAESWCYTLKVPFFRINPPLDGYLSAFETDDEKIINGLWLTKAYMHAVRPQLLQLVSILERQF